ncbi:MULTISPECIES: TRAP transporter substrate-binding protein [Rhodomicrobium]|uniref:TRAP transporter substrate-binding protein n=1 Tax=Rhodomicrobium TaxID=1068 RepID=UPI00148232A4|nr:MULTISPECIES: TRAP transporter substrate-binding protein [Rhodomicrobium]
MRISQSVIAIFLSLFYASSASFAAPIELRFAHNGGPGSLFDASVNEFARRTNLELPDTYRITVSGESKLGDDTAILQKIKLGEITFGLPSTVMSSISDVFGLFELPFLIRNREQVKRIGETLLEPVLQPEAKRQGFRILALWENGFRQLTNNVRPIHRPEDLRGLKIRVPKGQREKVFKEFGAEPVPLAFHEVHEALKAGTLDGQENPLAQIQGGKFYEVQHYLTLSDHLYTPAYIIVSDEHFSKLPPEVQAIITRNAKEMQAWIYTTAVRMESDLLDQLGDEMKLNQVDVNAFKTASRPLYGQFVRSVAGGAKLVEMVDRLGEETTATSAQISR